MTKKQIATEAMTKWKPIKNEWQKKKNNDKTNKHQKTEKIMAYS